MSQINNEELVSQEVLGCVEEVIKERAIKNYIIDVSPGSMRGDNYLGIIAKAVVKGKGEGGKDTTLNLIVKSAPRNETFRSLAPVDLLYGRETYMYSKVLPEFAKFQEERGILKPFTSYAKFYKSTMGHMNEALVMEDIKERGFMLRNRHEPLNYDHVLFVLKEYGKFHALSYALRDQKPELFKELSDNTPDVFFTMEFNETVKAGLAKYSDRALAALDPVGDKIAYDRFNNFKDGLFETVRAVLQPESAGKYAVIGHGDSWVNNMLFKYKDISNQNSPSEVCILDWQLSRTGSPALDLAYFIFVCTDKNLRDGHYDHLIQEYYNTLSSFLRKLGSDPDRLFPFEILQEHLKKFCVYGLYMAIMVLYAMISDTDEIPDINELKNEEELMEKFLYETKNSEKYNSRIRGVILDFVKYGYDF